MQRPFAGAVLGTVISLLAAGGCSTPSESCDINAVFAKYSCVNSGCHDATTKAANFDMATAGLENRLVGVAPPGGGPMNDGGVIPAQQSMCSGQGMNYLDPGTGSSPATGLFLRKLTASPGCGLRMPMVGAAVSSGDLSCIQTWANGVVAAHSSGG